MQVDFAEIQRQVRLACAPEPGDPDATERTCAGCGQRFWDWTRKWRQWCPDCSADRGRRQRAGGRGRRGLETPAAKR